MGTGVIYAVIVGMWAVVLIPMWLRKHDEANETKSADKFAKALGSLDSHRGSAAPKRSILMPRRPAGSHDTEVIVMGASAATASQATTSPAATAATRRRRVLIGLLLLTAVVLVAALVHRVPMMLAAVPLALVGGFLVVARRQVTLSAEVARRRSRRTSLSAASRTAMTTYEQDRNAASARRVMAPAPESQAAVVVPAVVVVDEFVADAQGQWHAVATTLPTYVTAPAATRIPRVIDLTTPGAWTGAAMVDQARATLLVEAEAETGMRVESFQISVPRDASERAAGYVDELAGAAMPAAAYDQRYVDTSAGSDELERFDDGDELLGLLEDPRTGTRGSAQAYRRAAG